ncbi:unnamed protein product [Haemonchus placei]|uniref:Cytochrome b-c1 complex subunit Rieske, mitochondrial n=1 Tax=Haemonchus placei TaxID=6290 RepID=A0A0N4XAQ4_HAEPC|nr:unnamed protein product [Haemonchus placei]
MVVFLLLLVPPIKDITTALITYKSPQAVATHITNRGTLLCPHSALGGLNMSSCRFAHTDIKFPDFSYYRRESTLDTQKAARDTEDQRRSLFHSIYYGAGGAMALWAAKEINLINVKFKFHFQWIPADQIALSTIEVNLDEIPEGETRTFNWRDKPVFVRHRTQAEIERERAVDLSELRHPEHDDQRVKRPEWSVLLGVCSHLGCVPTIGAGDYGAYFCPCHGSHFDASGRIRKGPAPLNMEVPEYTFKGNTLLIG